MSKSNQPLALVTGASRGIGAAIAQRLAKEGFFVAINYSSNESKAQEVLHSIINAGGAGVLCQFDVSNSTEVDAAVEQLLQNHDGISVLVNNAGIAIDALLMRLKNEELDRVLDIDLKGAIYCTRAVTRSMMKARNGSIIQISSVVGEMGNAGQSAYSAAKAGLIGFSKSIAKELAGRGIRVNVITPGFIQSDMTESLTDSQKEAILRNVPMNTLGAPDDVAAAVAFLAKAESRYITGQVLGVNGGLYM